MTGFATIATPIVGVGVVAGGLYMTYDLLRERENPETNKQDNNGEQANEL
jgi:hypothetical protein